MNYTYILLALLAAFLVYWFFLREDTKKEDKKA